MFLKIEAHKIDNVMLDQCLVEDIRILAKYQLGGKKIPYGTKAKVIQSFLDHAKDRTECIELPIIITHMPYIVSDNSHAAFKVISATPTRLTCMEIIVLSSTNFDYSGPEYACFDVWPSDQVTNTCLTFKPTCIGGSVKLVKVVPGCDARPYVPWDGSVRVWTLDRPRYYRMLCGYRES